MTKSKALLIDITKCIGCKACVFACKETNHLPEKEDEELASTSYTVVKKTCAPRRMAAIAAAACSGCGVAITTA